MLRLAIASSEMERDLAREQTLPPRVICQELACRTVAAVTPSRCYSFSTAIAIALSSASFNTS